MAKIKITEEERNSYISNESFLEHVYKSNSKAQGLKNLYKIILQQDFTCLQNNDLKNKKIIETEKTFYLSSILKEHECSISTPKLGFALAMSLAEEDIKALGVSDNDNTDV